MKTFNIIPVSNINSTNDYLKNMHRKAKMPEGSVILADFQSEGKGQGMNTWYSGKGLNILMSILLYPGIRANRFFFLTEMISLALVDALKENGIQAKIKWPNDIYVGDQKISGILIENILLSDVIETSVVGIGLNVNEIDFPPEIPNPVSVKQITGKSLDLSSLINKLLEKVRLRYKSLLDNQFESMHRADL
jgi:BirA family biotin operon repressor/biotin-[acetyl-CoA-carboxylase] ligase